MLLNIISLEFLFLATSGRIGYHLHKDFPQTCHPDEGRLEQSEQAKQSHLLLNIISLEFLFLATSGRVGNHLHKPSPQTCHTDDLICRSTRSSTVLLFDGL